MKKVIKNIQLETGPVGHVFENVGLGLGWQSAYVNIGHTEKLHTENSGR